MNTDNKISRRDFIRTSALTGGALLVSTAIPGQAMNLLQEQKNDNKVTNDELLKGVCDIHLHCRPDSRERSVDEYGFIKDAMAADPSGIAGCGVLRQFLHEPGAWRQGECVCSAKGGRNERRAVPLHLDADFGCRLPISK